MDTKNPIVLTTLTTVVATIAVAIVWYMLGKQQDLTGIAVFAVVYWVIFFAVQKWLRRK
jgi:hypothetical protein